MSVVSILGTTVVNQSAFAGTFPGVNGKIAFTSFPDGSISVTNPDGTGQKSLTSSGATPSWSPDGTKIAFDSGGQIHVMNADGSGQTNLTNNPAFTDSDPSWSPDGTKIAFVASRDGNLEIYVMNATDGSGQTRLTNNGDTDLEPSWSPDGTKIAFKSSRDGLYAIYVMNATDGSGQTRLTINPANNFDQEPTWSPDGTKIAFTSYDMDGNADIYVVNADGSGKTRLTDSPAIDWQPSWSPDGTKIVFGRELEIHVMNADGTGQTGLGISGDHPDWGVPSTTLTVNAVSASGEALHMFVKIRSSDGTILQTGFAPLTFVGNSGKTFTVTVANYFDRVFDHWEDGSTDKKRTITLSSDDTAVTAVYNTGASVTGFAPLTYTGTAEQPDLTVNTVSLGGATLHKWAIVKLDGVNEEGTSYTVAVSNYREWIFDHWEDGSTDRTRSLTIDAYTSITAYYNPIAVDNRPVGVNLGFDPQAGQQVGSAVVKSLNFVLASSSNIRIDYDLGQSHCCEGHHSHSHGDLQINIDGVSVHSDSVEFVSVDTAPGPNYKTGSFSTTLNAGPHKVELMLGDAGWNQKFEIRTTSQQ